MDNPISSTVADPRGFNIPKESNDETDLFGLLGRIVGLAGWADRITAAPLDERSFRNYESINGPASLCG